VGKNLMTVRRVSAQLDPSRNGRHRHHLREIVPAAACVPASWRISTLVFAVRHGTACMGRRFVLEETQSCARCRRWRFPVREHDGRQRPMKQPLRLQGMKSSGTSPRMPAEFRRRARAGSHKSVASFIPPQNCRSIAGVIPAGASFTPGFFSRGRRRKSCRSALAAVRP